MISFPFPWRDSVEIEEMADFVAPKYSKSRVVRAGKLLKGSLSWPSEITADTFKIARNWRACHLVPMRHVRMELSAKVKKSGGGVTAARLKRMTSIRAKLRRAPYTLYQMQDIAGCRAIMANQDDADYLIALFRKESRHTFIDQDDYIASPKPLGYRGHHLIYRYHGRSPYLALNSNPQFVEIQIRTKLQHAWATAVEAVGMVRGEELKSGQGDAAWLRLFALTGSEMAAEEGTALVPNTPHSEAERRREIIEIERSLDALASLSNYRNAVKITENVRTSSPYYLIQFDRDTGRLRVRGITTAASTTSIDDAEGFDGLNSVLVAVDKVGDLRAAYPNYFLDVALFEDRLRRVARPRPKGPTFNMDWLKDWIGGGR